MANSARRPILIIPACGESQRFKDAGVAKPKGLIRYSLEGEEKTMIEHAIPDKFMGRTYVVVKNSDFDQFRQALPLGIMLISISESSGQAETVATALKHIPQSDLRSGFVVVNCDNKFRTQALNKLYEEPYKASVLVFKDASKNKSFGYVDGLPSFFKGAEKDPISDYAIAGAFFFPSAGELGRAYRGYCSFYNDTPRYLTQLYGFIPGSKIAILENRGDMYDFGTPELMRAALGKTIDLPFKES